MSVTTDPNDPDLKAVEENGMQKKYLVLSEEERAKGFIRPVRTKYIHVGIPAPENSLRDLDDDERKRYEGTDYVKYEEYPKGEGALGRFWAKSQLEKIGKGCRAVTTMGQELSETYAREPRFYGATYCAVCQDHFPVGKYGEFVWDETNERVGT